MIVAIVRQPDGGTTKTVRLAMAAALGSVVVVLESERHH